MTDVKIPSTPFVSTNFEDPSIPTQLPDSVTAIVPTTNHANPTTNYWDEDPWGDPAPDNDFADTIAVSIGISKALNIPAIDIAPDTNDESIIEWDCGYDDCEIHEFPADWKFGGPGGNDPSADHRFYPDSYIYYDKYMAEVFITSSPRCDGQAIDQFTAVARAGKLHPVYLWVRREDEKKHKPLPVEYDEKEDMVYDLNVG